MKPLCVTAFTLSVLSFTLNSPAQDASIPKPTPAPEIKITTSAPASSSWIERTYRFPSSELIEGFATETRGQLRAPHTPNPGAPQDQVVTFLQLSHEVVTAYLASQGIALPKGSLLAFDPATSTLFVRTTAEGHSALSSITEAAMQALPRQLVLELEIYEADATAARLLLRAAEADESHQAAYQQMLGLVTNSKSKLLDSLRIETKGGQRASTERVLNYTYPTEFTLEARASVATAMETKPIGLRWEVDPVIAPDGHTIDLTFSFTHDYAQPTVRYEPVGLADGDFYEAPVTDFHRAEVKTAISLTSGGTRLVGAWRPAGEPKATNADVLDLAFITAHAVPLIVAQSPTIEALAKAHGEVALPTPSVAPKAAADPTLPPGMIVRRFRLPPDFQSMSGSSRDNSGVAADPFAASPKTPANEPRLTIRATALEILRAQGLEFPPGSSANFTPATSELVVRNTPANMGKIEAYVASLKEQAPKVLGFTIHLIEAPGPFLRQIEHDTSSIADHSAAWAGIEKAIADKTASVLSTQWLPTKGGLRASLITGDERTFLTGSGSHNSLATSTHENSDKPETKTVQTVHNYLGNNDRWQFSPEFEIENVGTQIEIDPVLSPDGFTLDLTCAVTYHYAPPLLQHTPPTAIDKVHQAWTPTTSFNKAIIRTQTTLMDGKPHLLSAWKPAGTATYDSKDIRQALFLIPHIQKVE